VSGGQPLDENLIRTAVLLDAYVTREQMSDRVNLYG
jgi:hypothetical protein